MEARNSDSNVLSLFTVDSFTSKPFTGNPAAVCLDNTINGLPDAIMQKIAAEMNISETGFARTLNPADTFKDSSRFGLRWFTPTTEVPLCGHCTLASAAVIFYCVGNQSALLTFETLSGELTARRNGDMVCLDLPLNSCQPIAQEEFKELLQLTTVSHLVQETWYSPVTKKLLVRLKDSVTRTELETMAPEIDKFVSANNTGNIHGLIITLKGSRENGAVDAKGEQYDFISRYFAPWMGIKEDPVTGAAHTVLAYYWSRQLGKQSLYARQCSARGGDLRLVAKDNERLDVAGPATIVLRGTISI